SSMSMPKADDNDPLKLDSARSWVQWLGPKCCLLQRARESLGRLCGGQRKIIRELLADSKIQTLFAYYPKTLSLQSLAPPQSYLPVCCRPPGARPIPDKLPGDQQQKDLALVEQSVTL